MRLTGNIHMAGWMVTVAVIKDEDQIGHEMYAVAIDDATQAMDAALKAACGEAAVLNGKMDEASMKSAGLEAGGILKILDDQCDLLTSRVKRH
jgi:hypothetical protein